eukprot:CAMPEP_0198211004 /NCGR_PEP_ID=MMETSP1445-20131203/22568_1 /TAXON_ID=36898 /ORGANISM="Pyramimonas sp., Strain CCMP2087" /LENGTH=243 /DNA_ID=CAMNT_0043885181 /DNA_START=128 /DNA_END=859 /DNA_ORIENTATION=-
MVASGRLMGLLQTTTRTVPSGGVRTSCALPQRLVGNSNRAVSTFSSSNSTRPNRETLGSSLRMTFPSSNASSVRMRSNVSASDSVTEGEARASTPLPNWDIRVLYDGDCPLCLKEINFLKTRNEKYSTIDFVDLSAETYSPAENQNISFERGMETIHGILPNGAIITGVTVFRRLYEAVGLGWIYAFLKIPYVGPLADKVYDFWAFYRLPITGRPSLAVVLAARRLKKGDATSYCSTAEKECK